MEDEQLTERVAVALRAATANMTASPELDARVTAVVGAEPRGRPRWLAPVVAAMTLALLAATGIIVLGGREADEARVVAAENPEIDAGGAWEMFDDGPLATRAEPQAVWTGDEMIVVGGLAVEQYAAFADGAAYDPASRRWRRIADRPKPGRIMVVAWTGADLFALGQDEGIELEDMRSAHLYNPDSNTWRPTTAPPRGLDSPEGAWWTGREVVVWQLGSGMLYDPASDTWRDVPPIDVPGAAAAGRAVWLDGPGVLAVQGAITPPTGGPLRDALFLFDPVRSRWRLAAEVPAGIPQFNLAYGAWLGSDLVFNPDPDGVTYSYEPASDAWRELPSPTVARDAGTGYFAGLALGKYGGVIRVGDSRNPLVFRSTGASWSYPSPGGTVPGPDGVVLWTGREVILWGRPADAGPTGGNVAWRWTPGTASPEEAAEGAVVPITGGTGEPRELTSAPAAPEPSDGDPTETTGSGDKGPVLRAARADLASRTITVTFDQPVNLGAAPLAAMYLVVFGDDPTCRTPAGNSHVLSSGAGTPTLTLDATSLARPTSYIRLAPGFVTGVRSGRPSEPTGCTAVPTT